MSERTRQIEDIFHAASGLNTPEERESYVNEACGGDADLRREVEAFLKAIPIGDDLFGTCEEPEGKAGEIRPEPLAERVGSVIGRYKLLEKIGEGGMGVVYMAEQEEPVRRKVALKIIKLGMDTRQVVARFEAERQALAMMDHPNIARVLDGGATDAGRPFFVMELVQGVPITEFCDTNHMSIRQRLELFIAVCHAIQSAHQKGIIHRDIKPSNVLVTMHNGAPHPMVIDFGVAKAIDQKLTEQTLFTNFATMIGTPAYMSPEQAEMSKLDVDTRSDIYSLGVLLYELLVGTPPFPEERLRSVAYREMQRIIAEEEPERPSTRLTKKATAPESEIRNPKSEIESDLDWIVMKCLEKDRNRRYETADGLAADLKRHLENEPVLARPPSALYRLQKFARRNKLRFAAVSVALVAVIGGLLASTWQAVRATRAESDALAVKEFLIEQLLAANLFMETANDPNRRRLLERVAEAAGTRFANQPLIEAEVRIAVGEAFHGIDDGDGAALEQFQKAHTIRRRILGSTHADTLYALGCAASAHLQLGHLDEGEKMLAETLAYVEAQGRPRSLGEVEVLQAYGSILLRMGREAEAVPYLDRATAAAERLADHKSWRYQTKLMWQIDATMLTGRTHEADALSVAGLRQAQGHFGANHPVTAGFSFRRADFFERTGQPLEAARVFEQDVLPVYRRSFGMNHRRTLTAELNRARSLEAAGEVERALQGYSDLCERVPAKLPLLSARRQLLLIGTILEKLGRPDLARAALDPLCQSLEINPPDYVEEFETLIQATAATKGWPAAAEACRKYSHRFPDSLSVWFGMACVFRYAGEDDGYRQVVERALSVAPKAQSQDDLRRMIEISALGPGEFRAHQVRQLDVLLQTLQKGLPHATAYRQVRGHTAVGLLQFRLGRFEESLAALARVGDQADDEDQAVTLMVKAMTLQRLGRGTEAREAYTESEAIMKRLFPEPVSEREEVLKFTELACLVLQRDTRALLGLE